MYCQIIQTRILIDITIKFRVRRRGKKLSIKVLPIMDRCKRWLRCKSRTGYRPATVPPRPLWSDKCTRSTRFCFVFLKQRRAAGSTDPCRLGTYLIAKGCTFSLHPRHILCVKKSFKIWTDTYTYLLVKLPLQKVNRCAVSFRAVQCTNTVWGCLISI